jgi:hypothetical protein
MFGIDPITLSSLLILAGNTAQCPAHDPTKIDVIPHTAKVKYDYSQSLEQIQAYQTDTIDPYAFHGKTITQGFMKGQIELRHKLTFGTLTNQSRGYGCLWYDTIRIELDIDPEIVIAKELYQDRCMRDSIIDHELKHVRVDRAIVNKYAHSIGSRVYKALKTRGFSVGPFDIDRMEEVQGKMQRVVSQILELEYKKLGIERQEKQRDVDSLEEYEDVDSKCPSFDKKKAKLYKDTFR